MTDTNSALHAVLDPERLAVLRDTALLDSPSEVAFDRLTRLAATVLRTPVALITLIDAERQFFKSSYGLPGDFAPARETPLSYALCCHLVNTGEPLIVADARAHPLLHDNLAVCEYGVVAYAGIPLRLRGQVLGSLCVLDHQPRQWRADEITVLRDLAESVLTEIELRVTTLEMQRLAAEAERQAQEAERRSREKLAILERVSDLFFSLDHDWHFTYLNQRAAALFRERVEHSRLDLVGSSIWEMFPEAVGTPFYEASLRAVTERRVVSVEAYYPPLRRWLAGDAYPTSDGLSVYFREVPAPDHAVQEVPPPNADEVLISLVARHDSVAEAALSMLYDRYSPAIYGIARRVRGGQGNADDLLQEVFWRVWQHADRFRPERGRFSSWLLQIATNLAISEGRYESRRPPALHWVRGTHPAAESSDRVTPGDGLTGAETQPDLLADPPEQVWLAERRKTVGDALQTLPEAQRQALELAYFAGYTHREIAEAQGAPVSTIKTRLSLGLRKLAADLARRGLSRHDALT